MYLLARGHRPIGWAREVELGLHSLEELLDGGDQGYASIIPNRPRYHATRQLLRRKFFLIESPGLEMTCNDDIMGGVQCERSSFLVPTGSISSKCYFSMGRPRGED